MTARGVAVVVCAFAASFAAGVVVAAETVGRLEFELPSPTWKLVASTEHPLRYQSGIEIPLFTKVYVLPGTAAVPKAMLIVTSTSGSHPGRTQWVTERCPEPRARYFATDFDTNKLIRVRECIVVNPAFVAANYFGSADPLQQAIKDAGVALPPSAYSLRSLVGLDGGTLVRVHLIAAKSFVGLPNATPAASETPTASCPSSSPGPRRSTPPSRTRPGSAAA